MWKPMHTQSLFAGVPFVSASDEPQTEAIFDGGVCLPSGTQMTEADVDRVCGVIRRLFKK